MNIYELARRIEHDLLLAGVDLNRANFYACMEFGGVFRSVGQPFNEWSDLTSAAGHAGTKPVYVFQPRNHCNPVQIISDPSRFFDIRNDWYPPGPTA